MAIKQMKNSLFNAINYNSLEQTLKYKQITNFTRTTSLKLVLVHCNICESYEYEKL